MGKLVLINPVGRHGLDDGIFKEDQNWNNALDRFIVLREELRGHQVHTIDKKQMEEADLLAFFGITLGDPDFAKLRRNPDLQENAILFLVEPPCVNRHQYLTRHHKYFRRVYTWNDSLADGKRYRKWNFPLTRKKQKWLPFGKKKFLCMISGNKVSFHKDELYAARYDFARWTQKNDVAFGLYGTGWNKPHDPFRTFAILLWQLSFLKKFHVSWRHLWYYLTGRPKLDCRGKVPDKYETLAGYKFCLCFENQKGIEGYITEKILDCFIAGTVPVYYGASNVEEHIPPECFIDYSEFESDDELVEFLENMTAKKYRKYRKAMKKFLKDPGEFSLDTFVEQIREELE